MKTVTDFEKLKHLYWRTGCGPDVDIINNPVSIEAAVKKIFEDAKLYEPIELNDFKVSSTGDRRFSSMEDAITGSELSRSSTMAAISNKWISRLVNHDCFLREKMAYFWANHFVCRIGFFDIAVDYANLLRANSLGNFRDLVIAVAQSAGMLAYLNSNSNVKSHPNQNFGRELMELFTLGHGNFSENDVKEAARAFTGWDFDRDTLKFKYQSQQHDYDSKFFFGNTKNFNGWEIIDVILEQKQCARFITTKIYKYFVNDNPDAAIINSLADYFYENNYNIELLMKKIFISDWFYESKNIGVKIKTPIDLLAGIFKFFDVQFADYKGYLMCQRLIGHDIFHPYSVAGWNYEKGSIDSISLMMRVDASRWMFDDVNFKVYSNDHSGIIPNEDPAKPAFIFNPAKIENTFANGDVATTAALLINFLIQRSDKKFNSLDITHSISGNASHEISKRIMATPEYQFC